MNSSAGRKTLRPKPPDKGSFPLDHEGEEKSSAAIAIVSMEYTIYAIDEYLKCCFFSHRRV